MDFRSGVFSGAYRPMEAMIWITEIESALSIAALKASNAITGGKIADTIRGS